MRYITECLELLIAGGHRSIEPRADKATDWHERSQAEMRTMVWSQPSIKHSFYKNSFGEVHTSARGGSSTTGHGPVSLIPTTSSS